MKYAVIGAGSWGSAFADYLARQGISVTLWGRDSHIISQMVKTHRNDKYLPEKKLHASLSFSNNIDEVIKNHDVFVNAISSQQVRGFYSSLRHKFTKNQCFLNLSKGIEIESLQLMHEVFYEIFGDATFATLSGPSHAEEVIQKMPTTLVCASKDLPFSKQIQTLSSDTLRIYTSNDIIGVESGGSLKNIIAIATGISDGLGFGDNTKSAIMTRGLHEITQLGLKIGAQLQTYLGLGGIGDLIVTCTSRHSRNRKFGELLGSGLSVEVAQKKVGMVVEGIFTLESAIKLAHYHDIEMPISQALFDIIHKHASVKDTISGLMNRDYKEEFNL